MTIECMICADQFTSYRRLCKHVRDSHKLTSRSYYDSHVKCANEGVCEYCGNVTKFVCISNGYRSSCQNCKSHKAKDYRLAQRNNVEKQELFVNKVKKNQKRIWDDRKVTGEDVVIRSKIGQTIKSNNRDLSKAELSEKYGWLNKLDTEAKEKWKHDVMFQTGCHLWMKTASDQEKQLLQYKRIATLSQTLLDIVKMYHDDNESYKKYCEAVNYITRINYFKFKDEIDPDGLRGNNYHLDHTFSKKAGFLQGIDPFIIGSKHNLRIIPARENVRKSANCLITIEELMAKYNDQ